MARKPGLIKHRREDLVYDPGPHVYTSNGIRVPSVTQCLDGILNDYSMVPPAVLERARIRGTMVHEATEHYDRGELDWSTIDDEIAGYLDAWLLFRDETGFTPKLIEHRVFSLKKWVAGTLDRTGYFSKLKINPEEEVIVDLKAVARMMPGTGPQTAAYKLCLNEERPAGQKIKLRYGVQLDPRMNPPYRLVPYKEDAIDEAAFLHCLGIKQFLQRFEK